MSKHRIFFIKLTSFSLIVILQGVFVSCRSTVNEKVSRIVYTASARAFHNEVVLTPDSVIVVKQNFRQNPVRTIQRRRITQAEWSQLIKSLRKVDVPSISGLPSPGDKRTYDGASHGSITIITGKQESFTHGFDDPEPNKKLQPLINNILGLRDLRTP